MQDFSEQVRAAREARAWTQVQLAKACGLHPRTIMRLEQGRSVDMETVQAIRAVLGNEIPAPSYSERGQIPFVHVPIDGFDEEVVAIRRRLLERALEREDVIAIIGLDADSAWKATGTTAGRLAAWHAMFVISFIVSAAMMAVGFYGIAHAGNAASPIDFPVNLIFFSALPPIIAYAFHPDGESNLPFRSLHVIRKSGLEILAVTRKGLISRLFTSDTITSVHGTARKDGGIDYQISRMGEQPFRLFALPEIPEVAVAMSGLAKGSMFTERTLKLTTPRTAVDAA